MDGGCVLRIILLAVFSGLVTGEPVLVDWCSVQDRLCEYQGDHIGCEKTQFPTGECQNLKVIHFDDDLKVVIIERHNEYRSKLALGEVPGFPKASKMQEMVWDKNLAHLAQKHVKNCNFKHDECRATDEFPYSGQNIALRSSNEPNASYPAILEAMIGRWFREYENTDARIVNEFTGHDLHNAGHFALISREENTHLGCGYITFESDDEDGHWYSHLLTCNYADNNWLGEPIYTIGEHCTQCKEYQKVCSKIYRGLCQKKKIIGPRD